MENENEIKKEKNLSLMMSVIVVIVLVVGASLYTARLLENKNAETLWHPARLNSQNQISALEEAVFPVEGVVLPIVWGNLGAQLVNSGAIDADKFKAIYEQRGAFTDEYKNLLFGENNGEIKITSENSGYILNLFWALGLANKNSILETGEMVDPKYGGAENFASTGGWTIAKGDAMDHYSKHKFLNLTSEQQTLVERVSRGIYRPCCGNSAHFPDCNHGMAMLGLLELMASQGVSEQDMWKTALIVNSYWFPDTYFTIATYMMKNKGIEWKDVNPEEMLGANYSSAQGFAKIALQVTAPNSSKSAGGCGVDAGAPVSLPQRQQSGCGVDAGIPVSAPAPKRQSGCGI